MARIHVRRLRKHEEFRECERIQTEVWGMLGVASEALMVTERYGGVVLGGWVGSRMAGFLYAFLARRGGRLIHWSHMMAVRPEFRDLGLGFLMKLAHRRVALREGIRSIGWTYDPLQSRNATLNLCRLGASVEEYLADCYGPFPSRIEMGLPSDRFRVNWRLRSSSVERLLRGHAPESTLPRARPINETSINSGGFRVNHSIALSLDGPHVLVEIPANTDVMRSVNAPLARQWRLETRRIFRRYFAAGYHVTAFLPPAPATDGRCYYALRCGSRTRT